MMLIAICIVVTQPFANSSVMKTLRAGVPSSLSILKLLQHPQNHVPLPLVSNLIPWPMALLVANHQVKIETQRPKAPVNKVALGS